MRRAIFLVSNSLVADNRNDAISIYALAKASVLPPSSIASRRTITKSVSMCGAATAAGLSTSPCTTAMPPATTTPAFLRQHSSRLRADHAHAVPVRRRQQLQRISREWRRDRSRRPMTGDGSYGAWEAANGGVVQSYGDNYIDGNAANEGPPPSIALK